MVGHTCNPSLESWEREDQGVVFQEVSQASEDSILKNIK